MSSRKFLALFLLCAVVASMAVGGVLPWGPATASTWRPCSTCSASHCGPLV